MADESESPWWGWRSPRGAAVVLTLALGLVNQCRWHRLEERDKQREREQRAIMEQRPAENRP